MLANSNRDVLSLFTPACSPPLLSPLPPAAAAVLPPLLACRLRLDAALALAAARRPLCMVVVAYISSSQKGAFLHFGTDSGRHAQDMLRAPGDGRSGSAAASQARHICSHTSTVLREPAMGNVPWPPSWVPLCPNSCQFHPHIVARCSHVLYTWAQR